MTTDNTGHNDLRGLLTAPDGEQPQDTPPGGGFMARLARSAARHHTVAMPLGGSKKQREARTVESWRGRRLTVDRSGRHTVDPSGTTHTFRFGREFHWTFGIVVVACGVGVFGVAVADLFTG